VVAGCSSPSTSLAPVRPAAARTTAIFTETNATSGNAVLVYARQPGGSLQAVGTYSTGGSGTGFPSSGLPFPIGGTTNSVLVDRTGTRLYAVDAGSEDVAAFTIAASGALSLIGRYSTGGPSPGSISIDPTGRYLYVLNTGTSPTGNNAPGDITGFTIASTGALTPLGGSTQPLSSAAYVDPSEVAFTPSGTALVVTEKLTGMIDIFPVTNGVAAHAVSSPSSGNIPFGFRFTPQGTLVVANAVSTTNLTAASVSSYTTTPSGGLTVISGQVGDDQGAACWVALTSTGAFGFAVNTLSGSISGYSISSSGALTLLTPGGVTASQPNTTGPIDDVVTADNQNLYVIDSMAGAAPGTIAGFSISANGSLTAIATGVSGLQPGTIGLAAR